MLTIYVDADACPVKELLAEQIRAEGARHHLDVVLTAKEYGTLEEVDSPSEIKSALVAGGVTTRDYPHVRTVTALAKEHLHLLVKPELAEKGISGLRGKRIALGPPTTASYHVARDVLTGQATARPAGFEEFRGQEFPLQLLFSQRDKSASRCVCIVGRRESGLGRGRRLCYHTLTSPGVEQW
jgi:hypothetical protein